MFRNVNIIALDIYSGEGATGYVPDARQIYPDRPVFGQPVAFL